MKEYDRDKKKWVETTGLGKVKKRETCIGKREYEKNYQ